MSKIEWTDATWNPMVGCSRASAGCDHCYAEGQVHRFGARYDRTTTVKLGATKRKGLTFLPEDGAGMSLGKGAKWTGAVWLLPDVLDVPLRRRKPTKYFVNSLSDVFHPSVVGCEKGRRFIAAMFGVMASTPQHTYQILTKRPDQAAKWFSWLDGVVAERVDRTLLSQFERIRQVAEAALRVVPRPATSRGCNRIEPIAWVSHGSYHWFPEADSMGRWPLPNVWIGASVEDQPTADARAPALIKVPAAVRFLSVEPMLGPVDLDDRRAWLTPLVGSDGPSIDWVICGGESGSKARPMHPAWARSLRDQCVEAGVPFHLKQWGEHAPFVCEDWFTHGGDERRAHTWVARDGSSGSCWVVDDDGNWSNWTGDPPFTPDRASADVAVMSKVGKAKAGRELDGRTWDEFPGGSS